MFSELVWVIFLLGNKPPEQPALNGLPGVMAAEVSKLYGMHVAEYAHKMMI